MVVRALPRLETRASHRAVTVPAVVLGVALVPALLDLLSLVQTAVTLGAALEVASGVAMLSLLLVWLRFPRTDWLAAASFAALASFAMRLVGADVAPLLSLLSIVALGIGGAFAPSELSPAAV